MSAASHPLKVVARLTGLSAHVIRIWEQRYGAVVPERTKTKRRLYTQEQIERLKLLGQVTQAGHNIGLVATAPTDRLRLLAEEPANQSLQLHDQPARPEVPTGDIIGACVTAIKALDGKSLEQLLKSAGVSLGMMGLLQKVIAPLSHLIGELWFGGEITIAHEHLATTVLRQFLAHRACNFGGNRQSPILVVATPAGQIHELGALLVAATASHLDWHGLYLGPSLPATELAGAVRQLRARAVALSLVYPEDDPNLAGELTRLRELLPSDVPILAGGRAMPAYRAALDSMGALPMANIGELASQLIALRQPAPTSYRRQRTD